jgi:hypothetical protein
MAGWACHTTRCRRVDFATVWISPHSTSTPPTGSHVQLPPHAAGVASAAGVGSDGGERVAGGADAGSSGGGGDAVPAGQGSKSRVVLKLKVEKAGGEEVARVQVSRGQHP